MAKQRKQDRFRENAWPLTPEVDHAQLITLLSSTRAHSYHHHPARVLMLTQLLLSRTLLKPAMEWSQYCTPPIFLCQGKFSWSFPECLFTVCFLLPIPGWCLNLLRPLLISSLSPHWFFLTDKDFWKIAPTRFINWVAG